MSWTASGTTPGGRRSGHSTNPKMSLHYIAPTTVEESLVSSTPPAYSAAGHRESGTLTHKTWETYNGNVDRSQELARNQAGYDTDERIQFSRLATHSLSISHYLELGPVKIEGSKKRRREEDRHNYDDEERYAILYLRIVREEKWSRILSCFNILFPPSSLRRQAVRGLTKTYPQREEGGLQCRYYRLRQDLHISALRSTGHSTAADRIALAELQNTLNLSEEFVDRLQMI